MSNARYALVVAGSLTRTESGGAAGLVSEQGEDQLAVRGSPELTAAVSWGHTKVSDLLIAPAGVTNTAGKHRIHGEVSEFPELR